jgi:AcrR family transcriptional regulator
MEETDALHARLLRTAFRLHSEPGLRRPSVRAIAASAGMSARSTYYWYGDIATLYRLAVTRQIEALAAPLSWSPAPATLLREAVMLYAEICARLFASEDYRRLAYLVMRDGAANPWLVRKHEQGIMEAARAGLARVVGQIRTPREIQLEIRASGTRAFVKRLQGELALPMLLPRQKEPTRIEVRALAEKITSEALESVYSTAAIADALGQLVRRPAARNVDAHASAA